MRTSLVTRLGMVAAAGLLMAACGGVGGTAGGDADGEAADSDVASRESAGGADAAGAIKVTETDAGEILTDAEGRALYAFTMDSDGKSACYAGCAETFPPLTAEGQPVGSDGVDPGMLRTVSREDGTKQVVFGKWPLYRFDGDKAAGDTQGQGKGDRWWLVSPDGSLIQTR